MAAVITGLKEITKGLAAHAKKLRLATEAALYQKGLAISADAVKMTPVDTGRLRGSAYVAPPAEGIVEVGYGAEYALAVHERTDAKHRVGEAKFLQKAADKHMSGFSGWIGKKARENYKNDVEPGNVRAGRTPKSPEGGRAKGLGRFMDTAFKRAKQGK